MKIEVKERITGKELREMDNATLKEYCKYFSFAKYFYALRLIEGYEGIQQNVKAGLRLLNSVSKKEMFAALDLGHFYWKGKYVKQDYKLAYKYYKLAHDLDKENSSFINFYFGKACLEEKTGHYNESLGISCLRQAASGGDSDAAVFLSTYYFEKNPEESYRYLKQFINSNAKKENQHYFMMAGYLEHGYGCKKDIHAALEMLRNIEVFSFYIDELLVIIDSIPPLINEDDDPRIPSFCVSAIQRIAKEKVDVTKKNYDNANEIVEILKNLNEQSTADELFEAGLKLYEKESYHNAMCCFMNGILKEDPNSKLADTPEIYDAIVHISYLGLEEDVNIQNAFIFAKLGQDVGSSYCKEVYNEILGNFDVNNLPGVDGKDLFISVMNSSILTIFEDEKNDEKSILIYQRLRKVTYEEAVYKLGMHFYEGDKVKRDYKRAYKFFLLGAEKNHPDSYYMLGKLLEEHSKELEVEKNEKQILDIYKKAAELNSVPALIALAEKSFNTDLNESLNYYLKAYKLGDKEHIYDISLIYGKLQEFENAYKILKEGVELNQIDCLFAITRLIERKNEELGVPLNYHVILDYYNKAKELGNPKALLMIGYIYETGKLDNKPDLAKAESLYNEALEKGSMLAYYYLGKLYYVTKKEYQRGYDYFLKGAEEEQSDCLYYLGYLSFYAYKPFLKYRRIKDAVNYYYRAYQKGHILAQFEYAYLCTQGHVGGKSKDDAYELIMQGLNNPKYVFDSAFPHYILALIHQYKGDVEKEKVELEISTKLNHKQAPYQLACYYRDGYFGLIDYDQAEHYFELAIKNGKSDKTFSEEYNQFKIKKQIFDGFAKNVNSFEKAEDIKSASLAFKLYEFYSKYAGHKDEKLANTYLKKAALLNHALANYYLGNICFENEQYDEARQYYQKAFDNGITGIQDEIDRARQLAMEQNGKDDLSGGYDVFVSWNTNDVAIKSVISANLKEHKFNIYDSDLDGQGELDPNIERVINISKGYIILLSTNAIKYSKYMRKEIKWILNKLTDKDNQLNKTLLKVIVLDDVNAELARLPDDDAFKLLHNLVFDYSKIDFDPNKLNDRKTEVDHVKKVIAIDSLRRYQLDLIKSFELFQVSFDDSYSDKDKISPTLNLEEAYVNRTLYDDADNKYTLEDIKNSEKKVLIYGEGGSGKSLYFKHMIRLDKNYQNLYFYLNSQQIASVLLKNKDFTFPQVASEIAFDNKYPGIDANTIINASANEYKHLAFIIDGLDEVSVEVRKQIFKLINDFKTEHEVKYFFTSRNKTDALLIHEVCGFDVMSLGITEFESKDIVLLFNSFLARNKNQIDANDLSKLDEKLFMSEISDVAEDIKKNPLLITVLIFIYFVSHEIKKNRLDILEKANDVITNHLEVKRHMLETQREVLKILNIESVTDILEPLAFGKSINNEQSFDDLIRDYIKKNTSYTGYDVLEKSDIVKNYLIRRKFISNERFDHEIFLSFYASRHIFKRVFEKSEDFITYKDEEFLKIKMSKFFKSDNNPWPSIDCDFIARIDYEIHNLEFSNGLLLETSPSYPCFNDVMTFLLKDKNISHKAIETISLLTQSKVGLFYSEQIIKYLK